MASRSISLPILFLVPAYLYSQSACPGLTFSGTVVVPLAVNSTDDVMARQPNGSYDGGSLKAHSFSFQLGEIYSNYQTTILEGCSTGTPTQTLPTLPDDPPALGVASQLVAIADFQNAGIPSFVFTTNSSSPVVNFGKLSLITGTSITTYPTSSPVISVAAGDFNQDGNFDFVAVVDGDGTVANPGGVQIFLGNGAGTFTLKSSYVTTVAASSVTVADLNKDGKLDLAVTGTGASAVTVLLGNGDGTFTATPTKPLAGQIPGAVISGDFNNDQNPDLAVANFDGTVSIFLGNGTGSFQPPTTFACGTDCGVLAAADFNNDGNLDLVVTDENSGLLAVLIGTGKGTFGAPTFYAAGSLPVSLIVTDFNNDGKLDIVVGIGTPDYIGPNPPTGNLAVLLGNGDGTFQGTQLRPTGLNSRGLVITDVNADGKPDVIVANQGSGNLTVFIGQGNGVFQAEPSSPNTSGFLSPVSVAAADFNGDSHLDLATAVSSAPGVAISEGNGDGTFQAPNVLAAGTTPVWVAVGDLNGDGKPDLVVADEGSQDPGVTDLGGVVVYLSSGSTFLPVKTFAAGLYPTSVAIADVNLDGKLDLVVSDYGSVGASDTGGVTVLLGNGDGTFRSGSSYSTGQYEPAVAVADVNGDGKPDIILPALGDSGYEVLVFLGKGDGTFQTPSSLKASEPDATVIIGDFNGDGKPDLLLANCCGATNMSYFLGNGNGTFQPEALFIGNPNPEFVASADFNNDGKLDLAIANAPMNSGGMTILLNTTPVPPVNMTANSNTTPQSAAAGSVFANALAVTVTNKSGEPVAGVSVTFTAPSSGASGTFSGGGDTFTTATNSSGIATAETFTANSDAGTYTVTATSTGLPAVSFALTNTSAATHPSFFSGEDYLSGNVYYLKFPDGNLFGYYEYLSSSILYHFDLGYEGFIPSTAGQIYFYDFASEHWWYTSPSLFPYLYDFTLNTFIFYFPSTTNPGHYTTNPRYFSNLATGMIFTM